MGRAEGVWRITDGMAGHCDRLPGLQRELRHNLPALGADRFKIDLLQPLRMTMIISMIIMTPTTSPTNITTRLVSSSSESAVQSFKLSSDVVGRGIRIDYGCQGRFSAGWSSAESTTEMDEVAPRVFFLQCRNRAVGVYTPRW
jgi:hypothetical protein